MIDSTQSVLVTGSSRGIGRAIALKLVDDGYPVVIHCVANRTRADELVKQIQDDGGVARCLQFDISDREQCEAVLGADIEEHGVYYGVVLNAGVARDGAFPALSDEDWDVVQRTNLDGFYNVLKPLVLPLVRTRSAADRQPISSKPQVGLHPDSGTMVFFGTGKFFEVGDNIVGGSPQTQTFYGVRDSGSRVAGRNNLQVQTILAEVSSGSSGFNADVRVSTDTAVDYSTKSGWYMDLLSPVNGAEGERSVSPPVIRNGRIIFTTLIPSADPCDYGGDSWIMELDAVYGKRLTMTPFDLNNDGQFDSGDYVSVIVGTETVTVPVSGKRSNIGIVKTPGIVDGGDKDHKYTSGSSGNLEHTLESSEEFTGRQSWRQLR